MGANSKIEWTHHTANLWWGCTRVHAGCDHCYAADTSRRWGKDVWDNNRREYKSSVWKNLYKWQAAAAAAGEMHRVFVGSMMDIFEKPMPLYTHEGIAINKDTGDLRDLLFKSILGMPNLMFLLLTKRPSNITKYIPASWRNNQPRNVMYGASVVDQRSAKDVARHFEQVGGNIFLSIEPLLEEITLEPFTMFYDGAFLPTIDWVIVGGESGPKKRPFNPDWARRLRDECAELEVPFFMKQIDKIQPIPGDLMIRQFPQSHNLLHP